MSDLKQPAQNSKMNSFQRRITFFGSGGPILDGYILIMVGFALTQLITQWSLTAAQSGILGAGSLLGMLLGGLIGGYVTDLLGRKRMYILDILVMVGFSALMFFTQNFIQLAICRIVIGVAIGADYPIASSLVSEFSTRKHRGFMVGMLNIMWDVGAILACFVGWMLMSIPDTGWRWMMLSAAVPGIILLLGRVSTPESPLWLANKGRKDEARKVLESVFPDRDISEFLEELDAPPVETKFSKVFTEREYLKRVLYCGGFYGLSAIPAFALGIFGPTIYESLGLVGNLWILGMVVTYAAFALGGVVALPLVERWGRRPLNIWSFVLMTIIMALLGLLTHAPASMVILLMALYAIASGGPTVLCWIVPNEIFPTDVRASATGVTVAVSRFGTAVSTYIIPSLLAGVGTRSTMLVLAGVCLAGVILCVALAPESKGKTLMEASALSDKK